MVERVSDVLDCFNGPPPEDKFSGKAYAPPPEKMQKAAGRPAGIDKKCQMQYSEGAICSRREEYVVFAFAINALLVVLGSLVGIAFRGRMEERLSRAVTAALGLVTIVIGAQMALEMEDTLCVIICMAAGTALGAAWKIEERLETMGEALKARLAHGGSGGQFTQGFVAGALLFCVGSMAVTGAMEAGLHNDYSILVSKGVIDGVISITFAATMGIGVAFSALPLLVYEGLLTLLFALAGPMIAETTLTQMSAVGGCVIIGIGLNIVYPEKHLPVGYMLPSIFLPLAYLPLAQWLGGLF